MWVPLLIPLIPLLIERILEFIDAVIILKIFPWWISAPRPPPTMLLQKPNEESWPKHLNKVQSNPQTGSIATDDDKNEVKNLDKVTYIVGPDRLDLFINTYEEAKFYYEREEKLHQLQLVYYISKYGYFLKERFLSEEINVQTWLFKPVLDTWELLFNKKPSDLDEEFAKQEGISQVPGDKEFAKILISEKYIQNILTDQAFTTLLTNEKFTSELSKNKTLAWIISKDETFSQQLLLVQEKLNDENFRQSILADMQNDRCLLHKKISEILGVDRLSPPQKNILTKFASEILKDKKSTNLQEDFTQKLELLAEYCYLRNLHTYEAFSIWKRQLYFLLGLGLGIVIVSLFDLASMLGLPDLTTKEDNLLNDIEMLKAAGPGVKSIMINTALGGGLGAGSHPTHALVNYISGLSRPRRRRPRYKSDISIASRPRTG